MREPKYNDPKFLEGRQPQAARKGCTLLRSQWNCLKGL